jgi:hypothetical protein
MERTIDLSLTDPRALIEEFHETERRRIAEWRLEKHWTPTPFPCESKGLV